MTDIPKHLEQFKFILERLLTPEQLDDHPWTRSLVVQDALARDPSLGGKSPGWQLALALGGLFREMLPATPPLHGKRIDTRWGRFGILAANYFAPLLFGLRSPNSLREAWRRIDQAILLFVFGKPESYLKEEDCAPYRLVSNEPDMAANSTISDWHRMGVEELGQLFIEREQCLSLERAEPSPALEPGSPSTHPNKPSGMHVSRGKQIWRWSLIGLGILLLVAVVIAAGIKGRQVLFLAQKVQEDVSALQALDLGSFDPSEVEQVGPLLTRTKEDLHHLDAAVRPWLWLTGGLGWLPVYGGDLKNAGDLLEMSGALLESADITYQSAFPVWKMVYGEERNIKAAELTASILKTRPALQEAQQALQRAETARERIDPALLSPRVQQIVYKADRYMVMLDESLSLSLSLPGLLGAAEDGPKTYLVLIQNEDELRPTGGFITSVGKLVVFEGSLVSWSVEDAYAVDNPERLYPPSPWQLDDFMNLQLMTFRDSNWFTDYPRAVIWAEYLYAFSYSHSVDGVIAIDQHVLTRILSLTGPVYVPGIDTTINAGNVLEVMRAQKIPPSEEERSPDWHRKQFMKPIASAVLDCLLSGKGFSWEEAIRTLLALLDERHILVQLDDPALTKVLAERGWDGAVRNPGGDFLMVVDTNVGYNKSNAVVSRRLDYDIDLSNLNAPVSSLTVFHVNAAQGEMGEYCDQHPAVPDSRSQERWYAINRCYYNYLRVYVPKGAELLDATPQAVTRTEMIMLNRDIPPRVDKVIENIENVEIFGTLLVVRMNENRATGFQFHLPASVLQAGPGNARTYNLKVQKQAGIQTSPITVRVHLPTGAKVQSLKPEGLQNGNDILFDLDLREDIEIQIVFKP